MKTEIPAGLKPVDLEFTEAEFAAIVEATVAKGFPDISAFMRDVARQLVEDRKA